MGGSDCTPDCGINCIIKPLCPNQPWYRMGQDWFRYRLDIISDELYLYSIIKRVHATNMITRQSIWDVQQTDDSNKYRETTKDVYQIKLHTG